MTCVCEGSFHQGKPCKNAVFSSGRLTISPALCTACIFGCEA